MVTSPKRPPANISKIDRTTAACSFVDDEGGQGNRRLRDVLVSEDKVAIAAEFAHVQSVSFIRQTGPTRGHGPMTNLELAYCLHRPINTITPRTNELAKLGVLRDAGVRACRMSGRSAHIWAINSGTLF